MPEFSPAVIVKLSDDLADRVPYQDDVVSASPEDFRALWTSTLPDMTLDRTLPTVDVNAVRNRLDQNERANGTPSHKLLAYYTIQVPAGVDGEALAAAVRSLPFVEHAYVEQEITLAGINVADDPLVVGQGFLAPAGVGVNAFDAWTRDGGDGDGVKFIDLEYGFLLNHEDLVAVGGAVRISVLPTSTGSTDLAHLDHSTRVLGVVMATDNDKGIVGIAPNVEGFAAPVGPGGAVSLDDTLINNLDSFTDGLFGQVFDRNIFDSGAIMVGAARSGLHERLFPCHGTRIDCFAWGENIMTTSATTNPPGGLNGYTDGLTVPFFDGTSGASAIIAGTAIALQGMHRKKHGSFLAPAQLRTLLSEIQFNTVPAVADIGRIGVMSDLQRLALEIGVM